MKPRDQWRGLTNYETDMLFNTFYGGQWTKLSSLKLRFAVAVPSVKSLAGMRACAAVEGFREFMERVDADRLKLASPKQVERCVPYAMALGVEHNWAEQFLGITKESPEWLVVARAEGIDATRWMRSLGSMAQEAETVCTARTRTGRYPKPGPVQELSRGTIEAPRR